MHNLFHGTGEERIDALHANVTKPAADTCRLHRGCNDGRLGSINLFELQIFLIT
jgi:hypothetical protein